MITKTQKNGYVLVKSDEGKKIRVKGDDTLYSEATEFLDKPREYEEADE